MTMLDPQIRGDVRRMFEPAPVATAPSTPPAPDPYAVQAIIGDVAGYVHTALSVATDQALAELVAAPEFHDRLYQVLLEQLTPQSAAERWGKDLEQAAVVLQGDAEFAEQQGNTRSALVSGAAARLLSDALDLTTTKTKRGKA